MSDDSTDYRALSLLREIAAAQRKRMRSIRFIELCCAVLAPWIVYLMLTLPADYEARRWRLAWVGFDVMLLAGLASTAYFGLRRRQLVVLTSLTTATLLVCDAWFDVMLSYRTNDLLESAASAVLVELPLAAFLLRRVHQFLSYTIRTQWYALGRPGEPPPLRRLPMFGRPFDEP